MIYECAICKKIFESSWSDEEALKEKEELWGNFPIEECVVICDDCFQKEGPKANPEAYKSWKDEINESMRALLVDAVFTKGE